MLQDNLSPSWYVIHTYSGYENRVATTLEKLVENRKLQHLIFSIKVPVEKVVDPVTGKEEERYLYPSYVLVKMIMNDESWHVVRNTRGVTGFVGPGAEPVVLSDAEVESLGIETTVASLAFKPGDRVRLTEGALAAHITDAVVEEISPDNKRVKVTASLHGRSTTIELDAAKVEKVD